MTDIETIDDMARVVTDWYSNMLARIANYQEIPTGMQLQIGEDTTPVVMEGDTLTGFIAAMKLIGMEMEANPPFTVTSDDAH